VLDNIGKTLRRGGGNTYQTMRKVRMADLPMDEE